MKAAALTCAVLLALLLGIGPARAQTPTGAICVAAFDDQNANGLRDAGEAPLAGINVNLSTGGAIIATHITAAGEDQFCFDNLLTGTYTVTFTDAPTHQATTANSGTFALDAGQRLTINEFGAVPVPLDVLRAELAGAGEDTSDEPMDSSTRLLLSTGGAMAVMLLLIGLGAVVLSWLGWRRARREAPLPPPPEIRPPGW